MARHLLINRGEEVRTKGKSMGRERSGQGLSSFQALEGDEAVSAYDDQLYEAGATDSLCGIDMAFVGRVILMLVGIMVMALGIDVVIKANLGNSPISAFPYVMSFITPQISFGTLMLGWQCFLVLLQVLILRRDFKPIALLQVPISVFFGICIDVFAGMLTFIQPLNYALSWVVLAVGMAILALGVTMTVISNTVMNCGEAVVQAVVTKTGIRFGTMKVIFDVSCALSAILLSVICMGHLEGVREGTVVCAALTGVIVNLYMALYTRIKK